jgi:hypothetical protein
MTKKELKEYINEKYKTIENIEELDEFITYLYNQGHSDLTEKFLINLIDFMDNREIYNMLLDKLKTMRNYYKLGIV